MSLNVIRDDGQEAEDADNLNQQLLAIIVLRLGGPLQESGHILGQLALRRRSSILVLNDLKVRNIRVSSMIMIKVSVTHLIVQHLGHGNGTSWEVRVEVLSLT